VVQVEKTHVGVVNLAVASTTAAFAATQHVGYARLRADALLI
jgi:hypothetical protein